MREGSNIINIVNSIKEVFLSVQSEISNYKDEIEFFCLIFFIIIVIYIYISYRKKINKRSKNHYENNLRSKKYIEDIYVEIGETCEKIRYFVYGRKWKKRIKKALKNIMSKNNEKIAKKICKINSLSLNKKLESYEKFLNIVKENKGEEVKYKNELSFLWHNSYYYKDEIEDLKQKLQIMNSRVLFVLGKAGSGKTNLATYIAKLISEKNKYFCVYMNAKDIKDGDIEKYFKEFFYTDIIINNNTENYIYLYLKILKFLNKKIYIIVEALNENPNSDFVYKLSMFINKYSKYNNLKFIITSRIEFFDVKYKKVIDEYLIGKYEIIEMDNSRINDIMNKRLIEKYRNYYNYTGSYNGRVKAIIEESPILTRIFFETYKDTSKAVNDINKYSLFLNYIQNVQNQTPNINVMEILNNIASKMLESKKYDSVCIKDIEIDNKKLEQLINENVLLNKSIIRSENSLEEEIEEIIMFTFDEIRDFLISKIIISNKNEKEILNFIKKAINNKESIAEGIFRNIYLNYKTKQNTRMCECLLKFDVSSILKDKFFLTIRKEDWFENFVLDMIFENNMPIFECEIRYINNINISKRDTWKIIRDLWNNTLMNCEPNFSIIKDEIDRLKENVDKKSFLKNLNKRDYEEIFEILKQKNTDSSNNLAIEIKKIAGVLYGETIS